MFLFQITPQKYLYNLYKNISTNFMIYEEEAWSKNTPDIKTLPHSQSVLLFLLHKGTNWGFARPFLFLGLW